jgi:N-methylhydantoinase A
MLRVGADIGGTFTDIVFLGHDGVVRAAKLLSTPDDYGRAILDGLRGDRARTDAAPEPIAEIVHGTTVATNAILEHKGAKVGLVTTKGFRDVLEIRRVRLPVLYDITWRKPEPLVRRERRLEVDERVGPGGEVRRPLDRESARAAIERLKALGCESVAVCLLHSYANAEHELAVGELAESEFPFVSLSCRVLPELKEYERTATTVVDAYVKPVVSRYLDNLRANLSAAGVKAPLLVMQSSGGIFSDRAAAASPVRIIESGPAAGVIAAAAAGRAAGLENLIAFDMGGTTAKASIVERGAIALSAEYEVGGGLNQGSRLIKGNGHLIRVPAIDVAEVGAGGGSLAWIDAGGVLRVGPESAGAVPGPACYGRGGDRPTVTDANLVLGYLNPGYLVGGELRLDAAHAERALREHVAEPLGLSLLDAAEGIHRIANAAMQRAIRSVSIERGRDPRDFTLVAFGGSGPVHAAGLAEALDIGAVLIPPHPGLFSAIGLLTADVQQLYTRSLLRELGKADLGAAEAILREMEARAARDLGEEGFGAGDVELERFADLRYRKQISELILPLPHRALEPADRERLADAFHREHAATYGYAMRDERIEIVSLKLRARGARTSAPPAWDRMGGGATAAGERIAHFGGEAGALATRVLGREALGDRPLAGPLVIEEYDSTTVVPPGWTARRGAHGFVHLERSVR